MVMPDRMRWVYLDPQGQVQGPFNGLEMNDWYKAQFFSPDLRVKKIEDSDFEPLGQLIRRIGNSREPFLVPQIGIPHGPPSQTGPFSPGDRGVIPPLMGAFPSFGRTLTAEEQNNLERRKQEEQILMARQREFLAHQQAFTKIQLPGAPGSLHHHSSAHSLQSQPSFGSITSPLGLPPQPPIGALGPTPGFFDTPANLSALGNGSDLFPPDLTAQERQMLASLQTQSGLSGGFLTQSTQPIGTPIGDGGLRSQLPGVDQLQKDSAGFSARLKEFNDIRAQRDAEENASKGLAGGLPDVAEEGNDYTAGIPSQAAVEQAAEVMREVNRAGQAHPDAQAHVQAHESRKTDIASSQAQERHLSLTEQVQKTQAAAAQAAAAANAAAAAVKQAENDDAWANASKSGMPMPFPPPSSTPLPAPTAKRQHSTLPTQFTGPSPTGTPDTLAEVAPPPLAPWASQAEVVHKGPSLKEIQEAEAKKAAKAEEAAAAARRALAEAEAAALREREKAAAIATGLPSSSTWGTVSPANTPSASSPWAKPAAVKGAVAAVATPVPSSKKTLAEIQREEEARKQKAKEIALQQGATPIAALGKRYADLASKTSAPPGLSGAAVAPAVGAAPVSGGGWATVGAGGKVKAPLVVLPTQARAAVSTSVKPSPPPVAKIVAKPSAPSSKDTGSDAMQEFHKWLHRELSRGLSGIQDSKWPYHLYPLFVYSCRKVC
jgi:PERQ amino acid-rich with GYF domain-containing protein